MGRNIENRIVRMEFDNKGFERRIASTLGSLEGLNKVLKQMGSAEGLQGLTKASKNVDLSAIASGVDKISSKFTALGAIGFAAIQKLTNAAIDFGARVGKTVIDPIFGGGRLRATNLEQARFLFQGMGQDIEAGMKSALDAVEGTAYGLDVAAKAAAQLGGSGLQAGQEMTDALRGIAGLAGLTNTSFEEIADIFITAAGNGRVMSNELGRISHRGVNAAAALAKQWNITEEEVREMASNGEISFQMFAEAMNDAFGEHATKANETYTGSLANMRAALGRLGASFFTPHLEQQRDLFNALRPVIDSVHDALKPLIEAFIAVKRISTNNLISLLEGLDFSKFEAATPKFGEGIINAFTALQAVVAPFKEAFRDIFPKSTASQIKGIANSFAAFTKALIPSKATVETLKRIFTGFFAALSIGWTVIKEGVSFIKDLVAGILSLSGAGSGGFLRFTANIADFFTNLQDGLVKGEGISRFFDRLRDALQTPLEHIQKFKDAVSDLFDGLDAPKVDGVVTRVETRFGRLQSAVERTSEIATPLKNALSRIMEVLGTIGSAIADWFGELGQKLADAIGPGEFNDLLDALNVSLLGGIGLLIGKWLRGGISLDLGGGFFEGVSGTLEELTGVLQAMQTQIKADALFKIAAALAVLTVSIVALSLIDSAALTKALTAMAVGFTQLMAAFAVLNAMDIGVFGGAKFTLVAAGITIMAGALLIMSAAMAILGRMSWEEIAKGLSAVTGMLAVLTAASIILSKNVGNIFVASIALSAMAVALTILAGAVFLFSKFEWGELVKGFAGVAAGLLIMAAAMHLMPADMALRGLGIILIATALNILAEAVKSFSEMNWTEMGRGMAGVGAGLLIIAAGMHLMPANMILTSIGLIGVSVALNILAKALESFGDMSWAEIGRGLAAMGGALLVLAIGTNAMSGALGGAAAMLVVSVALKVLVGVLKDMIKIPFGDLAKALGGIALALGLFALAGALMQPVIPALLGLGVALIFIGGAFALFGVGALAVAKAFQILADAGPAAAKAVTRALEAVGAAIPALLAGFAQGIIDLVQIFIDAAPVLAEGLFVLLSHILETIVEITPQVGEVMLAIVTTMLDVFIEATPDIVEAGIGFLVALVQGISDNMDDITDAAVDILVTFLNGIASNAGRITNAGTNVLIAFLLGIAKNINRVVNVVGTIITTFIRTVGNNASKIVTAGTNTLISFLTGIGNNLFRVVNTVASIITTFVVSVANNASRVVTAGSNAIIKFVTGLGQNATRIVNAGVNAIIKFIQGIGSAGVRLARAAFDVVIKFLNELAAVIRQKSPALRDAGKNLAAAVADGITGGFASKAKSVVDSFVGSVTSGINAAKSVLGIRSPSKVFYVIGQQTMLGFAQGIRKIAPVNRSMTWVGRKTSDSFRDMLSHVASVVSDMEDFNPVVTPVLDMSRIAADSIQVKKYIDDAAKWGPVVSFQQAQSIAKSPNPIFGNDGTDSDGRGPVLFEQNIYAPRQLSTSDIYKNTRNQITIAKEELDVA